MKDTLWIFGDSYGAKNENWIRDLFLTINCKPVITNLPGTSLNWAVRQFTRTASEIKQTDRVLFLVPDFSRYEVVDRVYENLAYHCTSQGFVYNDNMLKPPKEVNDAINGYNKYVINYYEKHIDHLVMCKWLQNKLNDITKYNCMIHTINNPNLREEFDHVGFIDYKPDAEAAIYQSQSTWFEFFDDDDNPRKEAEAIKAKVLHSDNHWVDQDGWREYFYKQFGDALNKLSLEPVEFGLHLPKIL